VSAHNRKLKFITLDIGGANFEIQLTSWKITNDTDDGEKVDTFAPDGGFVEEADAAYKLELKFLADWRAAGISDYLWDNDGETVAFQLDHLYDVPGEHVRFTGEVQIKAPSVGGDVRTTELTEVTLVCVDKPVKTRP